MPTSRFSTAALFVGLVLLIPAAAQSVPTGLSDEVFASGFSFPAGMAFAADERLFVLEKASGRVLVVAGGQQGVLGSVPDVAVLHGEQGALGIAVDPQWPLWPYLYLYHCHAPTGMIRLTRYTVSGDLGDPSSANLTMGTPYLLIDDIPDNDPLHNGGCLRFGPDGMLYISTGDDSNGCAAADPESLLGKILRLDISGLRGQTVNGPPSKTSLTASGNPYVGPNSQLVWATGLRNPFRFNIDPQTGTLVVGDVGQEDYEELNLVDGPGQDFGWPLNEGPGPGLLSSCPSAAPTPTAPAFSQPHGSFPISVIPFGGIYRQVPGAPWNLGPQYEGQLLYTEHFMGWVRRLEESGGSWQPAAPVPGQPTTDDWAQGFPRVSDALVGPDGALYSLHYFDGSIRRVKGSAYQNLTLVAASPLDRVSNAGQPLLEPLRVRCEDANGTPLPGAAVSFTLLSGDGALGSSTVFSDANGIAETIFTPAVSTAANPILVEASVPGSASLIFAIRWRGLTVSTAPSGAITLRVTHSETDSPVSVVFQDPPVTNPYITLLGVVYVELFTPPPTTVILDGLGLRGPADPVVRTGPVVPEWSLTVPFNGPTGLNLLLTGQAFAVDTTRAPALDAYLVSAPVLLYLP